MATKKLIGVYTNEHAHWVGDGFPVRSLFDYNTVGQQLSPFLLLDRAGPHTFAPTPRQRGVGAHPHRGFETVTIVYAGSVAHRDSAGGGGTIGPGDVQWMTAGSGLLHDEFHAPAFAATGGVLDMVQLWVNLPARHKMTPPKYQAITDADIPVVPLPGDAGRVRVIAGEFDGRRGPAQTFSPMNVWDLRLAAGKPLELRVPDGHTLAIVVLHGSLRVNGAQDAGVAQFALFHQAGTTVSLSANEDAVVLVLGGEPLNEPIEGYGPFVMNTAQEIHDAIEDFRGGRFGQMPDN
ncbi:MAG: pirin family protein [Gammaproteobacteria bacterium]